MQLLNFGGQLIKSIQKLQAAILHLGNVELVDGGDGESSKVANRPTAHLVARTLHISKTISLLPSTLLTLSITLLDRRNRLVAPVVVTNSLANTHHNTKKELLTIEITLLFSNLQSILNTLLGVRVEAVLAKVAQSIHTGLLGTPKEEIEKALTVRVVAAKRDVVEVKTKVDKAVYARDALAKVTTRSLHLLATSFADRTLALSCCPFLYIAAP